MRLIILTSQGQSPWDTEYTVAMTPTFATQKSKGGDFPGGPVIKMWHFHCRGAGLIPSQGIKTPHAVQALNEVWQNK